MYKIVSRKEAKDKKLLHYFSGKLCPKQHFSLRSVSNSTCCECHRRQQRQFAKRNAKAYKEYNTQNPHIKRDSRNRLLQIPEQLLKARYNAIQQRTVRLRRHSSEYKYYAGVQCNLTLAEFTRWSMEETNYPALHKAWIAAGRPRKLSPSIDRIDSDLHYETTNLQWLTCSQHSSKTSEDIKKRNKR